jgi:hypothetical protein
MILEPLEADIDKYKVLYKDVQKKINALHDCQNIESMTYEVIEITEEDYIKVILSTLNGPKVFLERKPSEICVNPYMKVVLSA